MPLAQEARTPWLLFGPLCACQGRLLPAEETCGQQPTWGHPPGPSSGEILTCKDYNKVLPTRGCLWVIDTGLGQNGTPGKEIAFHSHCDKSVSVNYRPLWNGYQPNLQDGSWGFKMSPEKLGLEIRKEWSQFLQGKGFWWGRVGCFRGKALERRGVTSCCGIGFWRSLPQTLKMF